MKQHGASVVVDNMSYQYMWGAEIDYKDDLQGASFVIRNSRNPSTSWFNNRSRVEKEVAYLNINDAIVL